MSEGVDDIEIEIVRPGERTEAEKPKEVREPVRAPRPAPLSPAGGQLLQSKVEFLEEVLGGPEGIANFIRREAEEILYKAYLVYVESVFRKQGISLRRARGRERVMEVVNEFWEQNKHDIVDMALDKFIQYLSRQGLERIADKYVHCWARPEFVCRLLKDRLVEDFKRSGTIALHYILDDLTPDLIELIYYVLGEAESQAS